MTTEEYRENAELIRLAKERAYKYGYQDAQIEVKDTAIAFAEWISRTGYTQYRDNKKIEMWMSDEGLYAYKIADTTPKLYDLFLASQNKQP